MGYWVNGGEEMKKISFFFILTIALFIHVEASAYKQPTVLVNGQIKNYDTPPMIKDGTTYIPIRGVSETFEAKVGWNQEEKKVTIIKENKTISFVAYSDKAIINDIEQTYPGSYIYAGRTYVPLRFVGEALDLSVGWEQIEKKVIINSPAAERIEEMILKAEKYLGTPYLYGGEWENDKKFDCSSFVQKVHGEIGVILPRTTYQQILIGKEVKLENLRKGDLMFFDTDGSGGPSHVVIYINESTLLHAGTSKGVTYTPYSDYWKDKFVKATRVVY